MPFIRKTALLSVYIVLSLTSLVANAQTQGLYHWIDEQGNDQFTQTPPPPNARQVDQKTIKVQPNLGDGAKPVDAGKKPPEEAVTEEEKEKDPAAAMKANKEKSCKNAKDEMALLTSTDTKNIVVVDPQDAQKNIPLTEEVKQKRIANAKAYYDTYCNSQATE